MKPRSYFRLALLFPYVLWGVCALIVAILSSGPELSEGWNAALMPVFFYVLGVIVWFVPYTLLAIGLWIWSGNQSTATLSKAALLAPILLSVLLLTETVLISLPVDSVSEFMQELLGQATLLGGFGLVFGYLCVGIALGVFKILKARHLIAEETPPAN